MKAPPDSRRGKRLVLAPDDYKHRRRERRMERTQQSEAEVCAWAKRHGFALRVLNGGHHWHFEKAGFVAEWWPRSGKLAINRDYLSTFHAPHWPRVAAVLEGHLLQKIRVHPRPSVVNFSHPEP